MRSKRILILTVSLTIAFLIALLLDTRIARFDHDSGLAHAIEGKWWAQVIKAPGVIWFTPAVAVLLLWLGQIRWKQAVFVVAAGTLSGVNALVKWIVGRTRPYKFPGADPLQPFTFRPFLHGIWGLFHQHDLCFPSGHESTAGALAAAMWFVWPRGRWIFLIIAVLVGIERVAENAHYASDVVAAAGIVLLSTTLLYAVMGRWIKAAEPRGFQAERF